MARILDVQVQYYNPDRVRWLDLGTPLLGINVRNIIAGYVYTPIQN